MSRRTDPRDIARIFKLLDEGFEKSRIAKILNLSRTTVWNYAAEWKEARRKALALPPEPPPDRPPAPQSRTYNP